MVVRSGNKELKEIIIIMIIVVIKLKRLIEKYPAVGNFFSSDVVQSRGTLGGDDGHNSY